MTSGVAALRATAEAPRRQRGLWRDAWYRLTRNRAAVVGLVFVVLVVLAALLASALAPYPFDRQDLDSTDLGPSGAHLFGTDQLGRDLLSRLLYGSRISLAVAIVDVLIVLFIGVPLGLAAGFFGGWVDTLVMRTVDILLAFPNLLLVIVVITYLRAVLDQPQGPVLAVVGGLDKASGGLIGVFIALGLISWLTVARLVRSQVLSLKEKEFVEAARMVGGTNLRIMTRHLLPNTLAPVIVAATFGIPGAIAAEAGLSFLGLGVRPPYPSWGILIAEGLRVMRTFPHELLFPAVTLAVTLICFNFLGDGLRDALDPKLKVS
ncbi:MAG TPA: ABC transporter permease [Candidatus Limnocylindria bacterium]|jgi:oligopeptide transport system permease protein|nr:ABC transporter permease [Candidatus Limnocylindria bacterium]